MELNQPRRNRLRDHVGTAGMEQMDCQTSRSLGHEQSLLAWEVVVPSGCGARQARGKQAASEEHRGDVLVWGNWENKVQENRV